MNSWINVLKINKNNISKDIFCYYDCNLSSNCKNIHYLSNFNNYYFLNNDNRNLYNKLLDLNIIKCLKDTNNYFFSKDYINLYPIFTLPDGNCLFHAIAIQIYGIPDINLDLKNLLLHFIQSQKDRIKEYWNIEIERSYKILNIELNQNIIDTEWKYELKCIFSKNAHQGLLSIFLLANIIRRAIIIVSSHENELEGLYLPFLIDFKLYNKNPIFIYYHNNHFTTMMCMKNNNNINEFILSNKPLIIHFYENDNDNDYLALWFHNYRKTDNYIISSLF